MTCIYQLDKLKKGGLNKIKGYMPTFSKNGELLATSKNEQVLIYDWDTNNIKDIKLIQTLIGAKGNLLKPIFSKDSNKIIAGDSEGFLAVWDLHSGKMFLVFFFSFVILVFLILFRSDFECYRSQKQWSFLSKHGSFRR